MHIKIMRYAGYAIIIVGILIGSASAFGAPYIVARGDSAYIPSGSTPATVWIFADSGEVTSHVYDSNTTPVLKERYDGVNRTVIQYIEHEYILSENISNSLDIGKYTLLFQRNGANTIKEISYRNKPDSLGNPHDFLVSPYKDVKDIPLEGRQQRMIRDLFLNMIETSSDDEIEEQTLIIESPSLIITDVAQSEIVQSTYKQGNKSEVYVAGETNLKSGTRIAIVWDEEKTIAEKSFDVNTFFFNATSKDATQPRTFNGTLKVYLEELVVGEQRYWITASAGGITSRVSFVLHESFNSTIKPQPIRYIDGGIIVTPTPLIIEKIVKEIVYQPTYIEIPIPTQPFPKNALGEEYDPTKIPDLRNIIPPLIFICLGVMALTARRWKL